MPAGARGWGVGGVVGRSEVCVCVKWGVRVGGGWLVVLVGGGWGGGGWECGGVGCGSVGVWGCGSVGVWECGIVWVETYRIRQ